MDKTKLNGNLIRQIEIRAWIRKSSPFYPLNKFPNQTHASS